MKGQSVVNDDETSQDSFPYAITNALMSNGIFSKSSLSKCRYCWKWQNYFDMNKGNMMANNPWLWNNCLCPYDLKDKHTKMKMSL